MAEEQKQEHDNIKDLHQVKRVDRHVQNKNRVVQVVRKSSDVIKTSGGVIKAQMQGDEEEDSGLQGQREIKEISRPLTSILGDCTDASRISELKQRAQARENTALAGDYFFQQSKTKPDGTKGTFDFDSITEGQVKGFHALRKNPQIDREKLENIINDPELQERASIKNRKARKQLLEMKQAVGANIYEANLNEFMEKNPTLFTDKQRQMIDDENGIFRFGEKGVIKEHKEVFNIYIKNSPEFGVFKEMNLEQMSVRDIKNFLLLKDKDTALKKGIKKYRINSEAYEAALYDLMGIKGLEKEIRQIGVGGKRTHLIGDVYNVLGVRGTEMDSTVRLIGNTVRTGATVAKVGYKGVRFTGRVAHRTADFGATLTANAMEAAGKKEMASAIRGTRDAVIKAEDDVKKTLKDMREYPRKQRVKLANAMAEKFKKTKLYNKLKNSKALQALGSKVKKVGHIAATPFRLVGATVDFVKKKLILPVVIAVGGLFLILVIISMFSGSGTSSGAVMTLILDTDEHFKDFQEKYDGYEATFQAQVNSIIDGFAQTTNKKGQQIRFGVNGAGNSEGNVNEDYSSGVTMNYTYDGTFTEGISSNIEDCLSVMTIIMQQEQESHHTEAVELFEALYKSSHSYDYIESALYPCGSGCETTHYNCNEKELNYINSELRFMPWLFAEVYKPTPEQECVVCKKTEGMTYVDFAGCVVVSTCYHGTDGDMGASHEDCDNYETVYGCSGHPYDNTWTDDEGNEHGSSGTDYCSDDLGCEGYYECKGHDHYGCPEGHDIKTCFGHVDLTMNVNIASLQRLMEMGGVEVKGESGNE